MDRRRIVGMALAAHFLVGVIVHPTWHRLHCDAARFAAAPSSRAAGSVVHGEDAQAASVRAGCCAAWRGEPQGCPGDSPGSRGHDRDHCPVCHVAAAASLAAPSVSLSSVQTPLHEPLPWQQPVPLQRPAFILPFSCGPPTV